MKAAQPAATPPPRADPSPPRSAATDLSRLRMLSRIAEQVGEGVVVAGTGSAAGR